MNNKKRFHLTLGEFTILLAFPLFMAATLGYDVGEYAGGNMVINRISPLGFPMVYRLELESKTADDICANRGFDRAFSSNLGFKNFIECWKYPPNEFNQTVFSVKVIP